MLAIQPGVTIPEGFEGGVFQVVKLAVLFSLLLYLVFAVVVIRQVQLMARTVQVEGKLDGAIRLVSWIHFTLAIVIFLLALFVL